MKCPIDNNDLVMSERHGVEIDYCPKCRGVWLDRGELDKIIDKAVPPMELAEPPGGRDTRPAERVREYREPYRDERYDDRYEERGRRWGHGHGKRRRHKSFLSEIFDFD